MGPRKAGTKAPARAPVRLDSVGDMRTLIVVESHWGNTEEIARAIAEGLAGSGRVDVVRVDDAPSDVTGVDLLLVGGPTHAFSMSRPQTRDDAQRQGATALSGTGVREWLARIDASARATQVALFDTKVAIMRHLPGSAAMAAARVVRSAGIPLTQRPTSFYVEGTEGPLLPGELARARAWGAAFVAPSVPRHVGVA